MGLSSSRVVAIVPTPLELQPGSGGKVLPAAYRHLSVFPVLAKAARGPVKHHPNERVTHFLKEYSEAAALVADFLPVRDRLAFLHTHKVGLPPKLLKLLLFNGPSRDMDFLYCPAINNPASKTSDSNNISSSSSACAQWHKQQQPPSLNNNYLAFGSASSSSSSTSSSSNSSSSYGEDKAQSPPQLSHCMEVRYRGSLLSRAVPLRLVAASLHRVIRSWLDNRLGKKGFTIILTMVNKLLAVFRPAEEVWYAIVNNTADDGTSLLTYALMNPNVSLPVVQKLLDIPCFDLGLPDRKFHLNAIQLAHRLGRNDVLDFFASLIPF